MERFSGGFPISDSVTSSLEDVVNLNESATVLRLLLQFMHPRSPPDCAELDIRILSDLADAAEKYLVYSAMTVCKIQMRYFIHPYNKT